MILDAAAKVPEATVLMNGDSPLFNSVSLKNPVRYYGFDTEKGQAQLAHYNTEGILCPKCEHILKYELNTYANLGAYICEDCGFKRPKLDYSLTALCISHQALVECGSRIAYHVFYPLSSTTCQES